MQKVYRFGGKKKKFPPDGSPSLVSKKERQGPQLTVRRDRLWKV